MRNFPHKIIVHHTASLRDTTNIADINTWHRSRGFPLSRRGYYVGYHYVVFADGAILQTRDDDEEGAHVKGQNCLSLGVCLLGNFSTQMPNAQQTDALKKLLLVLCARHNIPRAEIFPHRIFSETECYGTNLSDDWARGLVAPRFLFFFFLVKNLWKKLTSK